MKKLQTRFINGKWHTRKQIAHETGMSRQTITRYLKDIGIESRTMISPKEYRKFCEHYGIENSDTGQ